ncbi:hypothetical protein I552_0370 [Mycobacterium xenopi 3993]|nr:hypothetical protein I552_0370 [Mycobacterium xenopi 3993]
MGLLKRDRDSDAANIAWTTTGEIASAARATRLSPSRTCSTPAATVIKHVTAQPNWATRSATTTVSQRRAADLQR